MNKTLFTFAVAAAFAAGSAFADVAITNAWEDFEVKGNTFNIGDAITDYANWSADGADESAIAAGNNGQVLELKTEGSTLTRELDDATSINDAIDGLGLSKDAPVVFESDIKFVPSDNDSCNVGVGEDAKFAIYAYANETANTTNLVVFHYGADGQGTNEEIKVGGAVNPDVFTKVTVKVFAPEGDVQNGLFFTVALNGVLVSNTVHYAAYGDDGTWFKTVNDLDNSENYYFHSVCFQGTGAVDNLFVGIEEEQSEELDDWAEDVSEMTGSAADVYDGFAGSAFENVNASNLTVWAKANGVDFNDVATEQDAESTLAQAFLLNCDPDDVDDEAEEFVATITIDENGNIVVTPPADKDYNVTPQLKGKASLSDADWDDLGDYDSADTDGYQFFMLELSL